MSPTDRLGTSSLHSWAHRPQPRTFRTFYSEDAREQATGAGASSNGPQATGPTSPNTTFSSTESITPSPWHGSPNPKPKPTVVPAFPTGAASRPRLTSPQSHSANQKGHSAPTSATSNSASAACSLSTGRCPAFLTCLILRSEP